MSNRTVETPKTFIKRLFSFSIGTVVSSFISFFSVPILTWFVSPEDIGKAAAGLARGDFPYSTGQVVMVDGGMTLQRL